MEQIRIIKEMRENDRAAGRAGQFIRPRYMVWENVCFAGDTLVPCKQGYKRIDEIAVGDEVKTHTGQYMPVAKVYRTDDMDVVRVKVSGAEDIICTPNHPFLSIQKAYPGRKLSEARWVPAEALNKDSMIAYKVDSPTLPNNFISAAEAWALGRYIADGSVDLTKNTPRIFISVGNKKLNEARCALRDLPYEIHENSPHQSVTNMVFSSQSFYSLVRDVGRGAANKQIPPFVFQLSHGLQAKVLEGYLSGDGHIRIRGRNAEVACSTASRKLAYGIARIVRNVYHVGANIARREQKDGIIDGRIIKANYPSYAVTASLYGERAKSFFLGGFVWQPVKSVVPFHEKRDVWNLSVWEDNTYGANDVVVHNCGAFSANKGADFAAVLEETVRIVEPEAPSVPVPEKGWPTAGCLMGDGWSVAWRVLDAQFWGVPQRRRRIALVADFGGESAPEILFNPGGVQGNPSPSGKTRERTAEAAASGVGNSVYCLQGNGIDRAETAGCNGKGWREDVSYTLNTIDRPAVCAAFKAGQGEKAGGIGYSEEVSPTLSASPSGTNRTPTILDMSHACDVIRECGEVVPSLQARMGTGGNQVPLTFAFGRSDALTESDVASTQSARQGKSATDLMCAVDCRNFCEGGETNGTLQAKSNGGTSYNLQNTVRTGMTVRRLTPLECERLQGFPDGWTDIGAWTDSNGKLHKESSDSARYKAMGNSIALPPWKWVLKRLCANYERDATLGSLFDGVGGFPLIWSHLNGVGSVKWASEIEEFPIAVTKRHCEEGLI